MLLDAPAFMKGVANCLANTYRFGGFDALTEELRIAVKDYPLECERIRVLAVSAYSHDGGGYLVVRVMDDGVERVFHLNLVQSVVKP